LPVASIVGVGGWGPQDSDWLKHNSILRDLINAPWPVIYEVNGHKAMLTYYIAYQLPAAFVGKMWGWEAANHALFLYTLGGFFLSALWVWLLTGARYWWIILVFLFFSGMDIVGFAISAVFLEPTLADAARFLAEKFSNFYHIEWWSGWGFAQFSSMSSLMVWVPNQGVSGWLLTAMLLTNSRLKSLHIVGAFLLGSSALWAPFVTLGLLPFVLALTTYGWQQQGFRTEYVRQCMSVSNTVGILLALLVILYLSGRFQAFTMPIDIGNLYQEDVTLTFLRLPKLFLIRYFLFIMLEFAVLHVLLYAYLRIAQKESLTYWRNLLMISTSILLVLPILNWGWNNEPAMRTSIPALFITALVTVIVLTDRVPDVRAKWIRRMIASLLCVGSLTALVEFGRHAQGIYDRGAVVRVPAEGEVQTLFELQEQRYKEYYSFIGQYLGSAESQFVEYLGK
ncbi:MAG: hypothetical protein OEQ18_14635, partial [Gammaproteobacteria bacterium]|nr:hypothetical protein [Gammaproteobacteria bacterium]